LELAPLVITLEAGAVNRKTLRVVEVKVALQLKERKGKWHYKSVEQADCFW